jgi:GntR family transcriptional regulator
VKPQDFSIDFRSGVPVYIQLVEQMMTHLSSGELQAGEQIPTVRQMASELRINFNTVARAYRMLNEAGLISTQQGRGTYITEKQAAEKTEGLKQQALEAQIQRFFYLLKRQGYRPEEVEPWLIESLSVWKTGHLQDEENNEFNL